MAMFGPFAANLEDTRALLCRHNGISYSEFENLTIDQIASIIASANKEARNMRESVTRKGKPL